MINMNQFIIFKQKNILTFKFLNLTIIFLKIINFKINYKLNVNY